MRLSVVLGLVAGVTALYSEVDARTPTTVDEKGNAQCSLGTQKASAGEMSTTFANNYWSHLGCGEWEKAREILKAAPKAAPERGIGSVMDNQSDFGRCYNESFAYASPEYHNVVYEGQGDAVKAWVKHGFFKMEAAEFWDIQRAVVEACDVKLGLK